ncbi:MAG: phosphoribosylformimino-5-aminoimidazole carboxamide ribotide isomerase [Candidatus Latescibacterota bacterium]|nr:phosphoribosylformimino-5-aminoimidazole carboxamide ribotide isomerase [Candidatus Latescibacterota bacterium]
MRFRPCIDLHEGRVKQIVGASLRDGEVPQTHFASEVSATYYAELYARDGLDGGHVIKLGPGNDQAAAEALSAYPGGLQVGGGIDADNAGKWIERDAAAVIATSYMFRECRLHAGNLSRLADAVGRDRLVLDLSCAPRDGGYVVATDRWQRLTDFEINRSNLELLSDSCCEFLVHATHVEGMKQGIDGDLVALLAQASPLPVTYAGGVASPDDIEQIRKLGQGVIDYTVGSALDIFGGTGLRYEELVARHQS